MKTGVFYCLDLLTKMEFKLFLHQNKALKVATFTNKLFKILNLAINTYGKEKVIIFGFEGGRECLDGFLIEYQDSF